jgi:outer membrane protein TolC
MLNSKCLLIAFCLFGFPPAALLSFTQNSSHVKIYTLEEAVNTALQTNRDLLLAHQEVQRADAQIDEAYSNAYPLLSFTGQYLRNIQAPVMFLPANSAFNQTPRTVAMRLGSDNSFSANFSLTQALYSLKVNTAIKVADDYLRYAKYNKKAAEQDIEYQVKNAFYAILFCKKLLEVHDKSYTAAKANYENVKSLNSQGTVSEYDLLRSEVQAANMEPALIETKNNLEMSKNILKNLMSLDLKTEIDISGDFKLEDLPTDTFNEPAIIAVEKNPVLLGLAMQEAMLEKNITIQKADYYPTLGGFATYEYAAEDNTFRFKNYEWAGTFYAGLRISYPLFDGFGRKARIQMAVIEKKKVEIARLKSEEGLKIQALQAMLKMQEAMKRALAQEKSLSQAEKALRISETRYKNGIGTQLEILDTQTALTAAETNYAKAIYDFLIAKAEWKKYTGI